MKPLSLDIIAEVVEGKIIGAETCRSSEIMITGVAADSRKIEKGDLFVPIKGEHVDGHSFIETAFQVGAVCVFSELKRNPELPEGCYIIKVKNVQDALLELARYYMTLFSAKVVAITGSVGKTTTKDMIASVLSQKYKVLKTQGNYNTNVGLPLTVFHMDESIEVAVLEMGMNSFGEIHNLSKVTKPDVAIITNVGVAHIEMLGSRDGILIAKSEIFDFMNLQGTAVLNGDDDKLITLKDKLQQKISWFGKSHEGIYADNVCTQELDSTLCDVHTPIGTISLAIPVPGAHMVQNALAAVATGIELGLTLEEIKTGIEIFKPTQMRMAVERRAGRITVINDTYNANPVSTKAALDVLVLAKGRKVCILGDMGELGSSAEDMHREVGEYAARCNIDMIITIGNLAKFINESAVATNAKVCYHYENQEEFWEKGLPLLEIGDTVLVKASRSRGFEKTVEKLQGVN